MRELERRPRAPSLTTPSARDCALPHRLAIVGAGRLGTTLALALRDSGVEVDPPLRRGQHPDPAADTVLLCVGDAEIADAAATVDAGPLIGHCSGATGLEALGDRRAFSLHPLMTVAAGADPDALRGAGAAIDGSDEAAIATARALAAALGLVAVRIAPEDRAAYHAAASIASNFLVTLEDAAERLGAEAGLAREQLVPLVRAAVENWAALGPKHALTGPVARGDEPTVARQRAAVAQRTPELLELFDALTEATRRLAGRDRPGAEREPVAC